MAKEGKKDQPKASKRLQPAYAAIDRDKAYTITEAVKLVKTHAKTKFDETIDVSVNLGVDPRHSDQQVRGMVAMPNGLGKTVKVAVFARGDKAVAAQEAGADIVGAEDLAEKMQKGDLNYDRIIATPDMMILVGKLGKVLGPRGLMPNPKLGTVTPNVAEAVKKAKSGEVEFRVEKAGILHAGIGKASFSESALEENIRAFFSAVTKAKPAGAKGTYIKKVTISSTMGAGVKVDVVSLADAA